MQISPSRARGLIDRPVLRGKDVHFPLAREGPHLEGTLFPQSSIETPPLAVRSGFLA